MAMHFRAHPRRPVHLRAMLTRPDTAWQKDATVRDLSLGGARLVMSEPMTAGDRLVISFLAPSLWDPLAIPARVAWVMPGSDERPTLGVAFEPKEPSGVFALFELVLTLP
jgi:hypothetical protein